jgi:hypothetical protein
MDIDTHFDYYHEGRSPYIRILYDYAPDTLKFEGYFYLEEETMPVERILFHGEEMLHIEILQKRTQEAPVSSPTKAMARPAVLRCEDGRRHPEARALRNICDCRHCWLVCCEPTAMERAD